MTVRHLLATIDSAELTEWMAYFQLEREREKMGDATSEEDAWKRAFNVNDK